jgi:hypothetical protein
VSFLRGLRAASEDLTLKSTVVTSPLHSLTRDMPQAARDSVAGSAPETAIWRTSEGFVGPNALLGAGLGLFCADRSVIIHVEHQSMRKQ